MLRTRFPVVLVALAFLGALPGWPVLASAQRGQSTPAAQTTNRLFPNRASSQSEILRNPPRRPPPPPRPDTVSLPYNLVWGDTQNRLAALFAGVGAKVANKKTDNDLEIWTVTGLIAPNLVNSLFTFQDGQLAALEFDYGQPDWDLAKYNEMMGQFRRLLETKCEKPGEIVTREADQPTPDGLKQSLMGYKWSRGDTLVQLFYFSAEDPAKTMAYRSISVHYHYQDPNPPASVELPTNPGGNANLSPLFGGSARLVSTPEQAAAVSANTPPPATPAPATPAATEVSPAANVGGIPMDPTVGVFAPLDATLPSAPDDGKKKAKPRPTPEGDALPLPER